MSHMKSAEIEDDGFITIDMQKVSAPKDERMKLKPSRSATPSIDYPSVRVYGCLSPDDPDTHPDPAPPAPCKNWEQAVWEVVQDAEHGLDCARNRDDFDCTCGMLERLMDGHCEECGYELTSEHPGHLYSCPECTREDHLAPQQYP